MGSKARNYTPLTIKRLFGLSSGYCSFPGCEKKLVSEDDALLSNICHIEAAMPNGERYNDDMDDKDRADYDNLILLCPQHHRETNDIENYTVEVLKSMKSEHELDMNSRIDRNELSKKYNSSLAKLVNKLAEINFQDFKDENESLVTFNPEDKISYNSVKRYKSIFKEFKIYSTNLDKIYSVFEDDGSFKKDKILRNIQMVYLQSKGEILGEDDSLNNLRENSDVIIDRVKTILWEKYDSSLNSDLRLDSEDIDYYLNILIVDSFIRCKILEEPVYDS